MSRIAVLKLCFGDDQKPVDSFTSQGRADVCLKIKWLDSEGREQLGCPHNAKRTLWELLEAAVAANIKRCMALKSGMKLHVVGEEKLGTCKICTCQLPVKVHASSEFIAEQTDDETLAEFPAFCWVKKTVEELKK